MKTILAINLGVRFLLELTACIAMGMWGWKQSPGWLRWVWAIGLPIVAMGLWGTFAVPGDPSRSGQAPVPVPGIVRLCYEALFFGFASWTLYRTQGIYWGGGFAAIVLIHYSIAYERFLWLLRQ